MPPGPWNGMNVGRYCILMIAAPLAFSSSPILLLLPFHRTHPQRVRLDTQDHLGEIFRPGVVCYLPSPCPSLLQLGSFCPQTSRWKALLSSPCAF